MSKNVRNEDAFTGLEAAIVLIAFVVVAAVFSYVVLGAGFFTTQKSQEVVHTSVAQTSSSMEVIGDVIGVGDTTAGKITSVKFAVGLSAGGGVIDFNKVVLTYADSGTVSTLTKEDPLESSSSTEPSAGVWRISEIKNEDGTDTGVVLEPREQFLIWAAIPSGVTVDANHKFSLEVKPSVGAPLTLSRTAPAQIDAYNRLY